MVTGASRWLLGKYKANFNRSEKMIILKIVFLFIAVWFTFINITKTAYKSDLPVINLFFWAIGVVGFVVLQFDLLS